MALTTKISNAIAIAVCDTVVDKIDAGASPGYVEVRTGTQPANLGIAATGTLLATLLLSDPAFGDAVDDSGSAKATANSVTSDAADASGTAGYARAYDSDDTPCLDGSVGVSGCDFNFTSIEFQAGAEVFLTSWTVTMSEG